LGIDNLGPATAHDLGRIVAVRLGKKARCLAVVTSMIMVDDNATQADDNAIHCGSIVQCLQISKDKPSILIVDSETHLVTAGSFHSEKVFLLNAYMPEERLPAMFTAAANMVCVSPGVIAMGVLACHSSSVKNLILASILPAALEVRPVQKS